METHIAMLRGINVSGKNMIKMPALVNLMETIGFKSIKSYLQSGNLIFESEEVNLTDFEVRIRVGISETFGLDVPVIVVSGENMLQARDGNPYFKRDDIDETKLHVTFLAGLSDSTNLDKIDTTRFGADEFIVEGKLINLYCPGGYGNTKLTNNFFESKLKITATTRNWNTVNKLVEMVEK